MLCSQLSLQIAFVHLLTLFTELPYSLGHFLPHVHASVLMVLALIVLSLNRTRDLFVSPALPPPSCSLRVKLVLLRMSYFVIIGPDSLSFVLFGIASPLLLHSLHR